MYKILPYLFFYWEDILTDEFFSKVPLNKKDILDGFTLKYKL